MKNRSGRHLALALCLALVAALAFTAEAAILCWTTAGSTGTVDEEDMALVYLNGPIARIKGGAALPATVDIRYNIVALTGLYGDDSFKMTVRYMDNGKSARVLLKIKKLDLNTGVITTVLTMDSNGFPQSPDFQTRTVTAPCKSYFDFEDNVYYIEAQITKTAADGAAALEGILVCREAC